MATLQTTHEGSGNIIRSPRVRDRIDEQDSKVPFEQIEDGLPVHAPHNVAKRILEWEYGIEIERTRLRLHPAAQCPASSSNPVSFHAGTDQHGAGVSHGQAVLSASLAPGGDCHV